MADTVSSDQAESTAATATETTTTDTSTSTVDNQTTDLSGDERAELDRLRAIHKDERRWEKRAKDNYDDAQIARELKKILGGDGKADLDPIAEVGKLRNEIAAERTERLRADVARLKGVEPTYVAGSTQEEMEAAADRYLADINARVQAALQKTTAPVTESTSTVKSGDFVEGPKQLSADELKGMSPAEQVAAYRDGRLNSLIGRKT